jgi:dGTPase
LNDLKDHKEQSYLWVHFLHQRSEKYLAQTPAVQMVIDYMAGMTDNFFVRTLERIFVPSKIQLS